MSKTVKGARVRHIRSDVPTDVPTIPTNDDHTTGWLKTDIYIGELFINTSSTTPGLWFRDSNGTTKVAVMDRVTGKLPLGSLPSNTQSVTHNYNTNITLDDTITTDVQYIVVNDTVASSSITNPINNILLNNLELSGSISIVHISVNVVLNGGRLKIRFKNSLGNTVLEIDDYPDDTLRGIILMWNGTVWVVMSNTLN